MLYVVIQASQLTPKMSQFLGHYLNGERVQSVTIQDAYI